LAPFEAVLIRDLPQSLAGFVALRDEVARTPQGGAALLAVALLLYAGDEALGAQCLAAALDQSLLRAGPEGRQLDPQDLQRVELQVRKQRYLPRAYFSGAVPHNGYALPGPPYEVQCSGSPAGWSPEAGSLTVFVACSGASPRPVTLKRDEQGLWQAAEYSSLLVGIRNPA